MTATSSPDARERIQDTRVSTPDDPQLGTIGLTTTVLISEADWTLNYGVQGPRAIEKDVYDWARSFITEAPRQSGVEGLAQ